MWPFKKNDQTPAAKPPIAIGERFTYLGVTMVCSRHFSWPHDYEVVAAEYVTKLGEIKHAVFLPEDWAALIAEQAR